MSGKRKNMGCGGVDTESVSKRHHSILADSVVPSQDLIQNQQQSDGKLASREITIQRDDGQVLETPTSSTIGSLLSFSPPKIRVILISVRTYGGNCRIYDEITFALPTPCTASDVTWEYSQIMDICIPECSFSFQDPSLFLNGRNGRKQLNSNDILQENMELNENTTLYFLHCYPYSFDCFCIRFIPKELVENRKRCPVAALELYRVPSSQIEVHYERKVSHCIWSGPSCCSECGMIPEGIGDYLCKIYNVTKDKIHLSTWDNSLNLLQYPESGGYEAGKTKFIAKISA